MPTRDRIDAGHRLVITEYWGAVTTADVVDHYRTLKADPAFSPTFDQLADLRRATSFQADGAAVRASGMAAFAPGVRRAVVAPPGFLFGIARMFEAGAEAHGYVVEIFGSPADAEAWLGVPPGSSGLSVDASADDR